jgi:thiol-disulfide isomerase/thioredoxin
MAVEIPAPADVRKGQAVPAFEVKTTDGKTVKFPQDYKGKVVLLDFWATWCGPCRSILPALDALHRKYHDKGVEIIGISSENLEELKAFQADGKHAYSLFNDVSRITTGKYQAFAYPTLVLIDRKGIIQRIEVGAHPAEAMEKWIQELL